MDNPVNGKDYLVDYYALFGISPDADSEDIKAAHHQRQLWYHEDRYQGLAPEIKQQAQKLSMLYLEAYAVLSDPEKRRAYDEQLRAWQGPISKDGMPIIDLSRPYFSVDALLSGVGENAEVVAKQEDLAMTFSQYNEQTLQFVEEQYLAANQPDARLTEVYRAQLRQRDLHLSLLESMQWTAVGMHNRSVNNAPRAYLAEVEKELAQMRGQVSEEVVRKLLLLQGDDPKLLAGKNSDVESTPTDHMVNFEECNRVVMDRFERAGERIRILAKEREQVIEKRLAAVRYEYRPAQTKFYPRLLLRMEASNGGNWFALCLVGDRNVSADETVDVAELAELSDSNAKAEEWIARGYNIIYCFLDDDLNPKDVLEEVINIHFSRVVADK